MDTHGGYVSVRERDEQETDSKHQMKNNGMMTVKSFSMNEMHAASKRQNYLVYLENKQQNDSISGKKDSCNNQDNNEEDHSSFEWMNIRSNEIVQFESGNKY